MKRKRRAGATETFSVSVDPKTKAILKARADRLHGGNMSALITELGREAEKRDASEWLYEWAGTVLTDEDRARIDAELEEGWEHARRTVANMEKEKRKRKHKKRDAA
jgi:hypothetical protein